MARDSNVEVKVSTGNGEQKPKGKEMPPGDGPCEFRLRKKIPLPEAGNVVKDNWVGRVCGRRVRVYRGCPEAEVPEAVKAELTKSGIEIGKVTYEDLGFAPPPQQAQPAFINLTQQQMKAAAS